MISKFIKIFLDNKRQFLKYFIIGISAFALDIILLIIFKEYFNLRPVIAVIINQALMLNYVFFLNKNWSFGSEKKTHKQIIKYYILSGANYLFSIVWMFILNEHFLVNYLIARTINIALAVSWNFALYKYWVYV